MQVLVAQCCLTLCNPMDPSPPGSSVHGILQARILEWVPRPSPGDLPNPGIKPRSPTLQADSLLSEPPGKSKNTGVGSLSLLQGIFLTRESNQGLLHCRQILYQLSYQGSPELPYDPAIPLQEMKMCVHIKNLHTKVHSSISHNSQMRKQLKCSLSDEWINKL